MDLHQSLTALGIGLWGGGHCMAMCAGVGLAIESAGQPRNLRAGERPLVRIRPYDMMGQLLIMHLGRISAYATLGGIAAWLGSLLWTQNIQGVQTILKLLANSTMAVFALLIMLDALPRLRWAALERFSLGLWQGLQHRLGHHAQHLFPPRQLWQRFVIGYLWGLLPCGLVYSALALAVLNDSAGDGARFMFTFGLGTIPSLMLLSGVGSWMQRMAARRDVRVGMALVILVFALIGTYKAIVGGAAGGHTHDHHSVGQTTPALQPRGTL